MLLDTINIGKHDIKANSSCSAFHGCLTDVHQKLLRVQSKSISKGDEEYPFN